MFVPFPYIFHFKAESGAFGTIKFTEFIVIDVRLAVWGDKQLQIAVLVHSEVAKMQLSLETCLAETLQRAGELPQQLFEFGLRVFGDVALDRSIAVFVKEVHFVFLSKDFD